MELYGLSGVSHQAILQVTLNKRDLADLPNADIVQSTWDSIFGNTAICRMAWPFNVKNDATEHSANEG